MKKICCCTGHVPEDFPFEYAKGNPLYEEYRKRLENAVEKAITEKGVTEFYCGMDNGSDLDFAEAVLDFRDNKYGDVKLKCVIPCLNQCKDWDGESKNRYNKVFFRANSTDLLSNRYTEDSFVQRNKYMISHCNLVVAVWNGIEQGETWNTIQFAKQNSVPIDYVKML